MLIGNLPPPQKKKAKQSRASLIKEENRENGACPLPPAHLSSTRAGHDAESTWKHLCYNYQLISVAYTQNYIFTKTFQK